MFDLRHLHVMGQRVPMYDSRTLTIAHVCSYCRPLARGQRFCGCTGPDDCEHMEYRPCDCHALQQRWCSVCTRTLGLTCPPFGDTVRQDRLI